MGQSIFELLCENQRLIRGSSENRVGHVQSQRIKRRGGPQAIRSTASERKGGKGDWEGERHTASLCSLRVFKGNRESLQRLPVGNPMMGRNVPALAPGCASQ